MTDSEFRAEVESIIRGHQPDFEKAIRDIAKKLAGSAGIDMNQALRNALEAHQKADLRNGIIEAVEKALADVIGDEVEDGEAPAS